MALHHSPSIIRDGLVLYLDAANPRSYIGSGTAWNDLSGNGNNGTLANAPVYDSANAGFFDFDSIDDYAECLNTNFTAVGDCSIAIWCKSNNYITQAGITGNKAYFATGQGLAIGNISNPAFPFLIVNTDVETKNISFISSATYDWSYFVGVKSSNNILTYTNGILINSTTYLGSVVSDYSSTVAIGRYLGSSKRWSGSISSIKYYNRALSAAEIAKNFNAMRGRFGV